MLIVLRSVVLCLAVSAGAVPLAHATFSIVACEPETGRCGVAVATHNLAVGYSVPFAKAGVGAGVSQFETNPMHAEIMLSALERGETAQMALNEALTRDHEFNDGQGPSFRQIGLVSIAGTAAAFTGGEAGNVAAHRAEGWVSVQGNGLVSDQVLDAMWQRFQTASGSLEARLMVALEAGYGAGGQTIGVTSAALLVATSEGWPVDIDYRVDFAPGSAVVDLRKIFDAGVARQKLFQARRWLQNGDAERAEHLVAEALLLGAGWDRIWLSAARIAQSVGDVQKASERYCRFRMLNPVWAEQLSSDFDAEACAP